MFGFGGDRRRDQKRAKANRDAVKCKAERDAKSMGMTGRQAKKYVKEKLKEHKEGIDCWLGM